MSASEPHKPYIARTWRVRVWIQVAAVAQSIWWVWFVFALPGAEEDELTRILGNLALPFFVVVVPYLALWPAIRLADDGSLMLRGWTRTRHVQAGSIVRIAMTHYGLLFEFSDGSQFTSLIFQPVRFVHYARILDCVEALTGIRPPIQKSDLGDIARKRGLQLYPPFARQTQRIADDVVGVWRAEPEAVNAIEQMQVFTAQLVGDTATVTTEVLSEGTIVALRVEPKNQRARAIDVIGEGRLIVQIGNIGGRWELDYDGEGMEFGRNLIEAAVAGRVSETTAFGRSRVDAVFADGNDPQSTGYDGCLALLVPQPGWNRWGKRTTYEPYDDSR